MVANDVRTIAVSQTVACRSRLVRHRRAVPGTTHQISRMARMLPQKTFILVDSRS